MKILILAVMLHAGNLRDDPMREDVTLRAGADEPVIVIGWPGEFESAARVRR